MIARALQFIQKPSPTGRTHQMRHKKEIAARQKGVALVELMISVALGIIIIFGTVQLYTSARGVFRNQELIGHLMENGRTASEIMSRTIRLARYWGCTGIRDTSVTNHLANNQQGIHGVNNDANAEAAVRDGTDTITVYQIDDSTRQPLKDINDPLNAAANPDPLSTSAVIHINKDSGLQNSDFIAINNCNQGDIIPLTSVTTTGADDLLTITTCATCTQTYQTNASVYKVRRTRFYIGTVNGEPALFRQENGGVPVELIEGVEDMQIYYGEDTNDDGTVDRYVRPEVIDDVCVQDSNADCWRGIVNVRISLLLRTTEDFVTKSAQTYLFDGNPTLANDRRLRREFLNIITIRNHRK